MQSLPEPTAFTVSFEDATSGSPETGDSGTDSLSARPFRARRRNRHGRGARGPLVPQGLPAARTRAEKFEDLVVDSASRLRDLLGAPVERVEYLVEEVPDQLEKLIASRSPAPLGALRTETAASGVAPSNRAVVVIYRHPVEALCDAPWQLRELVHEVLIEQIAAYLGIDPDAVDPLFGRFRRGH